MPNDPSPPPFIRNKKGVLNHHWFKDACVPVYSSKKTAFEIFYSNAIVVLHTFVFFTLTPGICFLEKYK